VRLAARKPLATINGLELTEKRVRANEKSAATGENRPKNAKNLQKWGGGNEGVFETQYTRIRLSEQTQPFQSSSILKTRTGDRRAVFEVRDSTDPANTATQPLDTGRFIKTRATDSQTVKG
jgi:hypothetical protein